MPESNVSNNNAKPIAKKYFKRKSQIYVAPNPNSGCFILKSDIKNINLNIQIFDFTGKIVTEKTVTVNNQICIDRTLESNIYIIKYTNLDLNINGVQKIFINND